MRYSLFRKWLKSRTHVARHQTEPVSACAMRPLALAPAGMPCAPAAQGGPSSTGIALGGRWSSACPPSLPPWATRRSMTRFGLAPRPRHSSMRCPSPATETERRSTLHTAPTFPHLLPTSVTARLRHPRQARPHTMARSRTTFGLLLQFAPQRRHKAPSRLRLAALDAPWLRAWLEP